MLQFLPMIAMGLQAMSALSAGKNVAKGYQRTPAEIAQVQALANRDRLLQAYLNPNDTITKNITAAETNQLRNEFQRSLSDLINADRRQQLMGRRSFFNPERRDESISQFAMKGNDTIANTARSNALSRIMEASQGYGNSANSYTPLISTQQAGQAQNRAAPSTLFGMGADALQSGGSLSNIFSMLSKGSSGGWLNPDTGAYQ